MGIDNRICDLCGTEIPQNDGVVDAALRLFYHNEPFPCYGRVDAARRDYSRSSRGRWRTRSAVYNTLGITKPRRI